jgi:hypothetical protein
MVRVDRSLTGGSTVQELTFDRSLARYAILRLGATGLLSGNKPVTAQTEERTGGNR